MQRRWLAWFGMFLFALALVPAGGGQRLARAADDPGRNTAARPNIIVFLADDLGWGDLGVQGHPVIQTPHLDAFAKQGLRLTQCYSAGAVCSPSRSAILTGRTPYRNGVRNWIPAGAAMHLRASEITAPALLRKNGYATCHVGKWHLNGKFNSPEQPQPNDHGFDWWLATQNNAAPSHAQPTNFVRNGRPVGKIDGYSAPFVAAEAIDWLKNHRDRAKPFYLSVWTHEPHYPIASADAHQAKYPDLEDPVRRAHHANVTQLDAAFGALIRALDELKLADNTFVFFTSDNGPEGDGVKTPGRGSTGGLRGRKRAVYEGGVRVPGLARWPGKIAAGGVSDTPVIGSDLFLTALALGHTPGPTDRVLDGGDLLPLLTRGEAVARARPLYWHCPIAPEPLKVAMRVGDWKILADPRLTRFELYNVQADPGETKELSAKEPEKLKELQAELTRLQAEILKEGPDWERGK